MQAFRFYARFTGRAGRRNAPCYCLLPTAYSLTSRRGGAGIAGLLHDIDDGDPVFVQDDVGFAVDQVLYVLY